MTRQASIELDVDFNGSFCEIYIKSPPIWKYFKQLSNNGAEWYNMGNLWLVNLPTGTLNHSFPRSNEKFIINYHKFDSNIQLPILSPLLCRGAFNGGNIKINSDSKKEVRRWIEDFSIQSKAFYDFFIKRVEFRNPQTIVNDIYERALRFEANKNSANIADLKLPVNLCESSTSLLDWFNYIVEHNVNTEQKEFLKIKKISDYKKIFEFYQDVNLDELRMIQGELGFEKKEIRKR